VLPQTADRGCLPAGENGLIIRAPEHLLVHLRWAQDLIDRHYAEPLDPDELADAARISKFHFLRCFALAYGTTPAAYLAERRIERAQDLMRATNLTVTEVCMLVGYTSLGSFSSKFSALVGVSPSAYQASFAACPGSRLIRHHARLSDLRPNIATLKQPVAVRSSWVRHMITNVSLCTMCGSDQDAAKAFYVDKLGFVERTDVRMGNGLPVGDRGTPEPTRAGDFGSVVAALLPLAIGAISSGFGGESS
jgi:AraC-like DNA-binding protein